jgi:ATP-dependent Clp protease ATP-binding subunit ClpA
LSKCAGTLLFDEIEKAPPRILEELALQVLDAARFSKPAWHRGS